MLLSRKRSWKTTPGYFYVLLSLWGKKDYLSLGESIQIALVSAYLKPQVTRHSKEPPLD